MQSNDTIDTNKAMQSSGFVEASWADQGNKGIRPLAKMTVRLRRSRWAHQSDVSFKCGIIAGYVNSVVVCYGSKDWPCVVAHAVHILLFDGRQRAAGQSIWWSTRSAGHKHGCQDSVSDSRSIQPLEAPNWHSHLQATDSLQCTTTVEGSAVPRARFVGHEPLQAKSGGREPHFVGLGFHGDNHLSWRRSHVQEKGFVKNRYSAHLIRTDSRRITSASVASPQSDSGFEAKSTVAPRPCPTLLRKLFGGGGTGQPPPKVALALIM